MASKPISIVQSYINGLRSKSDEEKSKTVHELYRYVSTELLEVPPAELQAFMDEFNHQIFNLASSADINDKKGAILAIVSLISVDVGNSTTRITRSANLLRNLLPGADTGVIELTAKAVARLAISSGLNSAEYVEFEVKRAIEWLGADRNENRRQSAVILLRELAASVPTYFFQQVGPFFDIIFCAVRDPKPSIREGAVGAIRAALQVTAQREGKESQKPQWYQQCYDELELGFTDESLRGLTREDRIHGSLLVLNELLRCSNVDWETEQQQLEAVALQHTDGAARPAHHHQHLQPMQQAPSPAPQQQAPRQRRYKAMLMRLTQKPSFSPSYLLSGAPAGGGGQPLYASLTCRALLTSKYAAICHHVTSNMYNKSPYVQQVILSMLPRLAALDRDRFCSKYMSKAVLYIQWWLQRKDAAKSSAFLCLGFLAAAVRQHITKYVGSVLEPIKTHIMPKDGSLKKRGAPVQTDQAVYVCIWLLARAGRAELRADMDELLGHMLASSLTPALTHALQEVATQIPELRQKAGEGLMTVLSARLGVRPLVLRHRPPPAGPLARPATDRLTVINTVLAMRTLSHYEYDNRSLMLFIQYCADNYLTSEDAQVRLEAVRTTSHLLTPSLLGVTGRSSTLQKSVSDVISKLLAAGITDTDPDIRLTVFWSLEERFDNHLAQAESLNALFVSLNDQVFEIREMVLCIIGRLSAMNPAYVMPSLRKTLIQILTELEHSGLARNREQSARLLGHLVSSSPRLTRPYLRPIMKVLCQRLRENEPNAAVVSSILYAVGDLAHVSGPEMGHWVNELFPLLLAILADNSSLAKREAVLYTLANLVQARADPSGPTSSAYQQYPQLLDVLIGFLKTEQQPTIRRETIRVLGLLGALDPYRKRTLNQESNEECLVIPDPDTTDTLADANSSVRLVNMSQHSMDEFYPAVAFGTLMRIIRDPALSQYHTMVVQAISFIVQSLGTKCVSYLSQVMPCLLLVIRTADAPFREFLFQQLATLIDVVRQHIRPSLPDIFLVIREFWQLDSPLQPTLIALVEHIAAALGSEFKTYMPQLIPNTLRVLYHDTSRGRVVTLKLLSALRKVGRNLDDHLHLVLPPMVRLFDPKDAPLPVCQEALVTVADLATKLDLTEYVGRIMHPLIRCLDTCPSLRSPAMDTLCALVQQLRRRYALFMPTVNKVLLKHGIQNVEYDQLISTHVLTSAMEEDSPSCVYQPGFVQPETAEPAPSKKLSVSVNNLKQAWMASRRVSKDDWSEWLRRISIAVLKESPSHALRSCCALAQSYPQLSRDLFNAAFVSCWSELDKDHQGELLDAVRLALRSQEIPEITQTLLNLAEFMEHCDIESLRIESRLLGEQALRCRAYAKALHYKEEEFHKGATTQVIETLISVNNKLQQKEAAQGLLEFARKYHTKSVAVQERWHEKLHDWQSALDAYSAKLAEPAEDDRPADCDFSLRLGQMRCMEALGQWDQLSGVAASVWPQAPLEVRQNMARMAAVSSLATATWQTMEPYVQAIPRETQEGAFHRAVLAIKKEQYEEAKQWIDTARDLLDTELTAMVGESYQRAYGTLVSAQMLSELEEIITFKLVKERRSAIQTMWWDRLQGCTAAVEDWQRILHVRSLVLPPHLDMRTRLKFAALCRKSGRLNQSRQILDELIAENPGPSQKDNPHVRYAYIKYQWAAGDKPEALRRLESFVSASVSTYGRAAALSAGQVPQLSSDEPRGESPAILLSRCFLKLGAWKEEFEPLSETTIPAVLQYYQYSTKYDPSWYRAWHAWAFMNFQAVLFFRGRCAVSPAAGAGEAVRSGRHLPFVVPAVQGFVRSISLNTGSSLQDTLRLLTLWFEYGQVPEVNDALTEGLRKIKIDNWLQVIPQLIARIDTPRPLIARLITSLLTELGKVHPQALVYPLTVAKKSSVPARERAAQMILKNMREHSETLVQQEFMVSDELIRVAILWDNRWHEGLEEASRLYFGERNIPAMFAVLEPLHAMMERGPETLKEKSFTQAHGQELQDAHELCRRYKRSGNERELNLAWNRYYQVFRRISKQLPLITNLDLPYVSPALMNARDLELAIPGSYVPHMPIIRIARVKSTLTVFSTKQRPRKVTMRGSDGRDYTFLVKGHEDLRQDERVMQLFGLVNTLLKTAPETMRRNLAIQRFAVVPLSTNSGLIGWVPHSDTLHTLIRDHREKKKIMLNIEHKIMLRMAPDYEHLTLLQKVEVFEHALETTKGDDLARLLWLKSPSSEDWFDRRANFTRSLAVMSMVGYVLGLGDRHPSNLMLDRMSGKILHIDFGDCFEVAMTREKFPEKIPFRLTRMLVNAMEVTVSRARTG
ncbi:serine/threonine-protein kinase mTOR-like isoform X1 [Amphibalanus amphitrite]|uniref:serine/threonine-protein kinase mTOR-like isoform X1 n=2 Tax=Amphibalanus amphitrite TaxID=1232801 RepID=UPI001C91BCF5|nr:serine/threonine-protein kinase mTOR-like isoform X1 [Amphibalanus amphitrite]XP_043210342.1 serine/threonine-protein kinase mTOR-like isoform X1 [Amphibalanus amphitrite]